MLRKLKMEFKGRVKSIVQRKEGRNDNFIKCKSFCRQRKLVRITRKEYYENQYMEWTVTAGI